MAALSRHPGVLHAREVQEDNGVLPGALCWGTLARWPAARSEPTQAVLLGSRAQVTDVAAHAMWTAVLAVKLLGFKFFLFWTVI